MKEEVPVNEEVTMKEETPLTEGEPKKEEELRKKEKENPNTTAENTSKTGEVPLESITQSLQGVKHPLEYAWGFWMNTIITSNKNKWESNLVEMTSFDTVEDYWCLYHHMKLPSELNLGQDYAIFKKGISPMWEHDANKKGGRWLITFEKRRSDVDWVWLDVVLLIIGENFENSEQICGVVVNIRGKCKIAIWTADATDEQANMTIGRQLKGYFGSKLGRIVFQIHDTTKSLYMV